METYFTELCSRPCTAAFSSSCTHSQGIIETDLLSLLLRLHFFVLAAHSFRHFMVTRDTGRWLSLTLLSSNSSSLSDYLLQMLHLCSQLLGSYADLVAHPVFLPLMAPHSSPFLIHSQFLSVSSKWNMFYQGSLVATPGKMSSREPTAHTHPSKYQRDQQKPRNRTSTQQTQGQVSAPGFIISNLDTQQPV